MEWENQKVGFRLLGEIFEVVQKKMSNGEGRIRFQLPRKRHFTYTLGSQGGGWQEPHKHSGLSETYFVLSGRIWIATDVLLGPLARRVLKLSPGDVYTVGPSLQHNVYLEPEAEILTVPSGRAVPNPERKGNDWYPAGDEFVSWQKSLTHRDIALLPAV